MKKISYWFIISFLSITSSGKVQVKAAGNATNASEASTESDESETAQTSGMATFGRSMNVEGDNPTETDRIRILQEKVRAALELQKSKAEAKVEDNMKASQLVMKLTKPQEEVDSVMSKLWGDDTKTEKKETTERTEPKKEKSKLEALVDDNMNALQLVMNLTRTPEKSTVGSITSLLWGDDVKTETKEDDSQKKVKKKKKKKKKKIMPQPKSIGLLAGLLG